MLGPDWLLGLTIINKRFTLATDKALLKEVTKELWQSVKKLRPDLEKEPRMQLVLKALITIGDLPNPIEAAMFVGTCLEMEEEIENPQEKSKTEPEANDSSNDEASDNRRTVRRS